MTDERERLDRHDFVGKAEATNADALVERTTIALSRRLSRKHFLNAAGRGLLVMLGVGIISNSPLFPADRRTADASDCGGWWNCGVGGKLCGHCGGSSTSCPGGCTSGNSWTACCCWGDCCNYVTYRDCCSCSPSCSGADCNRAVVDNWCAGIGSYGCTLSIVGANCGGQNCPEHPALRSTSSA